MRALLLLLPFILSAQEPVPVFGTTVVIPSRSRLYIDAQLIADNDFHHGPTARVVSLSLSGGIHTIRVPCFRGPRDTVALTLEIADPEKWRFASAPIDAPTHPGLSHAVPETIPDPRAAHSKKKRNR